LDGIELVIAEKKTLAEAIAAVLPGPVTKERTCIRVGNVVLTWLYGHALEQAMPEDYDPRYAKWDKDHLPIIPATWVLKPKRDRAAELKTIRDYLKKATRVVNAGDPDAEGQLLVDEVLEHYGNTKPVDRVLVSDYEPIKVREALAARTSNTHPRFVGWRNWALCRSRLDWLFGLNMTRAYTLRGQALGYQGVLTVGRVQTPTLALVVARDEAIERFKPIPFYRLVAQVEAQDKAFVAYWRPHEGQAGLDEAGRLIDRSVAETLLRRLTGKPATVSKFEESAKKSPPPLPFDLTALQCAANEQFGYSAQQVLDAAQALYNTHKVLTYPRGDSRYLSVAQHAEAGVRLQRLAKNLPELAEVISRADVTRRAAAFNDAKVTAHHATVPTAGPVFDCSALSECERNVYMLVARAYIALFYPDYQYTKTTAEIVIEGETFRASGIRPTAAGWKAVFKSDEANEDEGDEEEPSQTMPRLVSGQAIALKAIDAQPKNTTAPARFTEKTLLTAMSNVHLHVTNPAAKARLKEGQGIGTPATRAPLLEDLKRRKLLAAKGKQIISTLAGRALVHALPSLPTDAGFTGITEQTLDLIAAGRLSAEVFLTKTAALIKQLTDQAQSATFKVPPVSVTKKTASRKTTSKSSNKVAAKKTATRGKGSRKISRKGVDR
jgi:DNA topoisomerase-3